jgi:hypothetical protein
MSSVTALAPTISGAAIGGFPSLMLHHPFGKAWRRLGSDVVEASHSPASDVKSVACVNQLQHPTI